MPLNKQQLRRLSLICQYFNDKVGVKVYCNDILTFVNDRDFNVCKSTIEKDIKHLKNEYDLDEFVDCKNGSGYICHTNFVFLELLKNHLNLF